MIVSVLIMLTYLPTLQQSEPLSQVSGQYFAPGSIASNFRIQNVQPFTLTESQGLHERSDASQNPAHISLHTRGGALEKRQELKDSIEEEQHAQPSSRLTKRGGLKYKLKLKQNLKELPYKIGSKIKGSFQKMKSKVGKAKGKGSDVPLEDLNTKPKASRPNSNRKVPRPPPNTPEVSGSESGSTTIAEEGGQVASDVVDWFYEHFWQDQRGEGWEDHIPTPKSPRTGSGGEWLDRE